MDDEPHEQVVKRATRVLAEYKHNPNCVYVMRNGEQPTVADGELCLTDGQQYVHHTTKEILFNGATFCVHVNLWDKCELVHVSVRPGFKAEMLEEALKVIRAMNQTEDAGQVLLEAMQKSLAETTRRVVTNVVVETKLMCVKCGRYILADAQAVVLYQCGKDVVTPAPDDCIGCFHPGCYMALMNDDEAMPDFRLTYH